ncbi:MAG: DUF2332 family protein [Egibacteraceae bacterium]
MSSRRRAGDPRTRPTERLRAALEVAQRIPALLDRAPVGAWLPERLAEPATGVATVVFHSIVLQDLSRLERATFHAVLDEAGARATPGAPLHWLYLEPETPETPRPGHPVRRRADHLARRPSPPPCDERRARGERPLALLTGPGQRPARPISLPVSGVRYGASAP